MKGEQKRFVVKISLGVKIFPQTNKIKKKSFLSLCNPTRKLVFTAITKIVNFGGGWHHTLPHFLSPLSDTQAQDPGSLAPSGSRVKSLTQRLGKKKAGAALFIAAIPWIWQGRNCRSRANISQNIYNADSDHGREWEWSGVWVELTHKWEFIKVQQAENPLLISQLSLLIHLFLQSAYLLLPFNFPSVSALGQFRLK